MKKFSSGGKKGAIMSVSKSSPNSSVRRYHVTFKPKRPRKPRQRETKEPKPVCRKFSRCEGLPLSCPRIPVLGRGWPLHADDPGKIQFAETLNCGRAYRPKSAPSSRAEKQGPSRAAIASTGICDPSIMTRRFSLRRNFRTIPFVVLYAPPAFRLSG